jgi:hypothetical protein
MESAAQHILPFADLPLAYLDPGTGSFILQAIVGVVLGAMLTLKMYWRRIRDFASGWRRKNRNDQ